MEFPRLDIFNYNYENRDQSYGLMTTVALTIVVAILVTCFRFVFSKLKSAVYDKLKSKFESYFSSEGSSAHQLQKNPSSTRYDIRTCSICLNNINHPVMSACNHPFCAECIAYMWETKQKQKLQCPNCRRDMNLLYRDFEENELSTQEEKKTLNELKEYNAMYSGQNRSYSEMVRDSPFLLRILFQKIRSWDNVWYILSTILTSGRLIASILYILSPFDLLPEALLGPIGFIDDLFVFGIAIVIIANISYQILRQN